MVKALLDGRKTQTRRVLKPQPPEWATVCSAIFEPQGLFQWSEPEQVPLRPLRRWPEEHALRLRFAKGDRLYVRENWRVHFHHDRTKPRDLSADTKPLLYMADETDGRFAKSRGKPRRAMHMPRWASRLTLTVTDLRVQRLQEISETDAKAEGVETYEGTTRSPDGTRRNVQSTGYLLPFTDLWERINGPGSWDANPWVVAVSFTVARRNIDA